MEKINQKISSRKGRFKKKLVSHEDLLTEGPIMIRKIAPFKELFEKQQISACEFTACYLIAFLSHRYPGTWAGSLNKNVSIYPGINWRDLPFEFEPNILNRLKNHSTLFDLFSAFSFKSTPLSVQRAILEWSKNQYHLELMYRIPSPKEVLKQQRSGKRCVTTITDERLGTYILNERDPLSFTMHDLIHADHFYYHNLSFEGQLGFYGLLDQTIDYFDLSNEEFCSEFEYLISDMNAYPIHLLKCLKSAMIFYFSEEYFVKWCLQVKSPESLLHMNTISYQPTEMDQELLTWLSQFKYSP